MVQGRSRLTKARRLKGMRKGRRLQGFRKGRRRRRKKRKRRRRKWRKKRGMGLQLRRLEQVGAVTLLLVRRERGSLRINPPLPIRGKDQPGQQRTMLLISVIIDGV